MAFTCPRCGMTSQHPEDEKHGYCGACHDWTGDEKHEREERELGQHRRRRQVDFTGAKNLGSFDLSDGVFVTKTHHAYVEPRQIFEAQDEPLFAVQFLGFGSDGEDNHATILLRPHVAGQLMSAIITVAAVKGLIEEVTAVVSDELRHTTLGKIGFDIKRVDVKEN